MLGHLVYSRPIGGDEHETHAPRSHAGWLERILVALRRKRPH
jgi:hypothetical protein